MGGKIELRYQFFRVEKRYLATILSISAWRQLVYLADNAAIACRRVGR